MTQTAIAKKFPFELKDLKYFIVKRRDGLTIKYNLIDPKTNSIPGNVSTALVKQPGTAGYTATSTYTKGLSAWCHHNPADLPLFTTEPLDIYIADAQGFRNHYKEFGYAVDCGDILMAWQVRKDDDLLAGDRKMVQELSKYYSGGNPGIDPRVLRIDWADRKAPLLKPEFWPALVASMEGTAVIACQGGHGRSGTGAVCMMMVMNPEYSPADAIIHLRAIHCARAIESKEQHEYIGMVGQFLGRPNDIARIGDINSFKDAFLGLKLKSAKPYQDRLREDLAKGSVVKADAVPEVWD